MARLIWDPRAIEDLKALATYISRDSHANAKLFVTRLMKKAEMLAEWPDIGSTKEDFPPDIRQILFKGYRIIYRLRDQTVIIFKVHHGAAQLDPADLN